MAGRVMTSSQSRALTIAATRPCFAMPVALEAGSQVKETATDGGKPIG